MLKPRIPHTFWNPPPGPEKLKSLPAKFNMSMGWDEWVPELTKKYKLKLFGQ